MAVDELVIKWSMDNKSFNDGLTNMNRSMNLLKSEFGATSTKLKSFGSETDQLRNKQEYLNKAMEIQKSKIDTLKSSYDKQVEATGENSKEAENLAIKLNNQVGYYNKLEEQLKKTNSELELQTNKWNTLSKNLNGIGSNFTKVGDKLTDIGKSMSLKVTTPIVAAGAAATKTAIDWESAFAGVKKTIDGTEEDFKKLSDGIREMSKEIPSSASDIASVAEAAGQLGIQTENILGFTRTIIDLGNATNLTGEEGASSLAKFANITGMAQTEFDRLGSTIVALGNNSATTEADIVAMAMRLAGAGTQVGMTEAQILSLSAALSSVGIEAEAGGSAFSKVLVEMQLAVETGSEKLTDFASVAGMTTDEFSRAFKEDATSALTEFITGLSKAEENGSSAIKVLDDMGISEVRLRDSLLRAGSASELFNSTVEIGTKAWEENTALANEANQRYETTASKMEIAKNKMADVGIQIGEVLIPHLINLLDKISNLATWFGNLSPESQKVILVIGGLVAAIGPLLVIGGAIASGIGSLLTLFGTISGAIAVVATGATAATPAIGALATVFTILTGPVGIVIGVVAGLIAIGVLLWKNWDVIKEKAGQLGDWLGEKWKGIKDKTSETWNNMKEKTSEVWGNMKAKIEEHGGGIKGIIGAYSEANKNLWSNAFNAMDNATGGALGRTKEKVSNGLNSIKSFFSNLSLPEIRLPHIKLPHFSLSGSFSLKPPSVPRLSVDWYHTGAIFTKPTVLGGIGVGDAYKGTGSNAEAVIPLDSMYQNVRSIVREEQTTQPIYVVVNVSNNMDNKAIGKAVTSEVKKEITRGTNNYRKGKGGLAFV